MNTAFDVTIVPTYDADKELTGTEWNSALDPSWKLVSQGTGDDADLFTVANVRSLTSLPFTGSGGIAVFVILGAVLLAAGSGLFLEVRRRQSIRVAASGE